MTAKRSKFDWSLLDRKDLTGYVYSIWPEVTEKRISIPKFHKTLSKHLKSRLPIMVTRTIQTNDAYNKIYIAGTYYSNKDRAKKRCIEIHCEYNQDKTILITKKQFRQIAEQIADTILHEIVHMRQHRRRKFKWLPDYASTAESSTQRREQEYLGNTDEIDAYSFNIACYLMEKFKGNSKLAVKKLNSTRISRANWGWKMYMDAFDHDHNHPIIQRLKKKIIRYFPNAIEGKPYLSKDWINH